MGLIEDELLEVKKLCEHIVPNTKLISCVPTMVRTEIKKTNFKNIVICAQFPKEYPHSPLLIELKSKTLSDKLLLALTNVCERELKTKLGKPQILHTIKFVEKFIEENPLTCCYDEINNLKKILTKQDQLKLKQKTSSLILKVYNEEYYWICKITVPNDYPCKPIDILNVETNFTPTFHRHMVAQAKEIARRCVEPPLKKKPKDPPFQPSPSLEKTALFLIDCIKRLPTEKCQFCKEICFHKNPKLLEHDEKSPKYVERVYCGHLFHQGCLLAYMKQPPFGNKTCSKCGNKIHHFKWNLTDKMAEAQWAHEQARERELQEVTDFFK
ncbi:hypothetical protein GWI33_004921 [Rhynchophorus ferrugineus]|uniref:RWD domain-containing protein n=1 Tax=Rhynchophorus ferrugineus TaxID=354439 RepID=A0A834MP06_RHYFE|nr:hypothetical protein GWI33_004921 [Rhynchophorus ferrugineus]